MTVDPGGGLEGEEGTDAPDHGAEHFVPKVEVVVGVARPVPLEDAVVGILGGVRRPPGREGRARLHAFEDEVHPQPLVTLPAQAVGPDPVFILDLLVRPAEGKAVVAGESLDPMLVNLGPLGQSLLGDGIETVDVAEEMNDMLGASQQGQITLDDDTVETVVYQNQQAAQQLGEGPLLLNFPSTRSWDRGPVEIQRRLGRERFPRPEGWAEGSPVEPGRLSDQRPAFPARSYRG